MLLDARRETQALRELVRIIAALDDDVGGEGEEGGGVCGGESKASARDSNSSQCSSKASVLSIAEDILLFLEADACVAAHMSSALAVSLLYVRSTLDCLTNHCRSESCPFEAGLIKRDAEYDTVEELLQDPPALRTDPVPQSSLPAVLHLRVSAASSQEYMSSPHHTAFMLFMTVSSSAV